MNNKQPNNEQNNDTSYKNINLVNHIPFMDQKQYEETRFKTNYTDFHKEKDSSLTKEQF